MATQGNVLSHGADSFRTISLLLLEDEADDVLVIADELKQHGFRLEPLHVAATRDEFLEHLSPEIDLIVADFALLDFNAFQALHLRNEHAPDVPFIVVSGRVTETQAIDLMRQGADDYLMKDRLRRLSAAVERAIHIRVLERSSLSGADEVTGLARAPEFLRVLAALMATVRPLEQPGLPARPLERYAIIRLDLDRFQTINASLGHAAGDDVLREIAERLRPAVASDEWLARLGGDEFALIVGPVATPEDALDAAERIQHRLAAPILVAHEELYVSAALGIAVDSGDYIEPLALVRDAEMALYKAKSMGRAQHQLFEGEMRAQARERLRTETELRQALDRREFRLHFQPIVELATNEAVGYEALLRWAHPERGLLSPSTVIPLAEENGLIYPIGAWVLEESVRAFRAWCDATPSLLDTYISVNVSAFQFRRTDLVEHVDRVLRTNGVDARNLRLEVTETALMQANEEHVVSTFAALRALGVGLLLDDFGTGYSSLSYLSRYPVDGIKIDRSFVSAGPDGQVNRAIVLMVLGLAERLELPVIAEGIETDAQHNLLELMGCRLGQGYLFSRAIPSDDVAGWHQSWRAAHPRTGAKS